jgi:uncharacterized repeat protein (TIGR03803 family)
MFTLNTLVSFNNTDGDYPTSGLTTDAAGDLFGTTNQGGANNDGTIFEIINTSTGYAASPTTLVSFNGTDGNNPYGGLFADASGNLFGTTQNGGANGDGTIFEIPFIGGSYATTPITLVSFTGADGDNPMSGLFADSSGDLFGTTNGGGPNGGGFGDGSVFELPFIGGSYATTPTTLFNCDPANGMWPEAGLIADAAGNLFGTTSEGGVLGAGAYGRGTVFEIAYTNGSYAATPTTLVNFDVGTGANDGGTLTGGLVMDSAGDLFGTTQYGGPNDDGEVFEIAKIDGSYASTPTILVTFDGTNGTTPVAGLTIDAAGDLFGTTYGAGSSNDGTAFEIVNTATGYASTPTTLASFDYNDNGAHPLSGLIANSAGDLFGTTSAGGTNGGGTAFELIICYLPGTQIATPSGEVPVEQLAVGDLAMTLRGEARRIVWIGEGRVLATRGRRTAATPVIVRKGALADNVPHHDLRITKAHSLYIDDVLIPVEFLVNHRSILWDDRAQEVTLYHIELETHDVLLANGAPAESYRDDGNRWLFRNANSGWSRPPQEPCAPVLTGGAVVDAAWRRLLERAGPRSSLPLTEDADLHVLADGRRLDAAEHTGQVHVFHLPAVPSALRIVSRAAAPAELGLARDPRALGVALRRLVVREGTRFRVTEAQDDRLADGFHAFEADPAFRWTDGDAAIPAELFAGFKAPFELVLHVGGTARYLADGAVQRAA